MEEITISGKVGKVGPYSVVLGNNGCYYTNSFGGTLRIWPDTHEYAFHNDERRPYAPGMLVSIFEAHEKAADLSSEANSLYEQATRLEKQAAAARKPRQVFYTGKGTASWGFPAEFGKPVLVGRDIVQFPEIKRAYRIAVERCGPAVYQHPPVEVTYVDGAPEVRGLEHGNSVFGVRAGVGAAL